MSPKSFANLILGELLISIFNYEIQHWKLDHKTPNIYLNQTEKLNHIM